jgi:hypothetical protein
MGSLSVLFFVFDGFRKSSPLERPHRVRVRHRCSVAAVMPHWLIGVFLADPADHALRHRRSLRRRFLRGAGSPLTSRPVPQPPERPRLAPGRPRHLAPGPREATGVQTGSRGPAASSERLSGTSGGSAVCRPQAGACRRRPFGSSAGGRTAATSVSRSRDLTFRKSRAVARPLVAPWVSGHSTSPQQKAHQIVTHSCRSPSYAPDRWQADHSSAASSFGCAVSVSPSSITTSTPLSTVTEQP